MKGDSNAKLAKRLSSFLKGSGAVVLRELDAVTRPTKSERTIVVTNRGTERAIATAVTANRVGKEQFASSPFVACVGFSSNGVPQRALICRGAAPDYAPKTEGCDFVSYLAPRGRLAAIPLGREYPLVVPAGRQRIAVFERHEFDCERNGTWDATNNVLESLDVDAERFPSLRALISSVGDDRLTEDSGTSRAESSDVRPTSPDAKQEQSASDLDPIAIENALKELRDRSDAANRAAEERRARAVRASRRMLKSVELRDQPTLDADQDEVFRLPINSVIALTGAPGTGKTTTLIKRIAQKSQHDFLSSEEKEAIGERALGALFGKRPAWVLFTPNDLLLSYVKDAIGKEGLKTSPSTLRTWHDQQRKLARDVFELFGNARSRYEPSTIDFVRLDANQSQWDYVDDFETFWSDRLGERIQTAFERTAVLGDTPEPTTPELPGDIREAFEELSASVRAIAREANELERLTGGRPVNVALASSELRVAVKDASSAVSRVLDIACRIVATQHPEVFGVRIDDAVRKQRLTTLRRLLSREPSEAAKPATEDANSVHHDHEVLVELARSAFAGPLGFVLRSARSWSEGVRAARWLSRGIDALFSQVVDSYRLFRRRIRSDANRVDRYRLEALPVVEEPAKPQGESSEDDEPLVPEPPARIPLSDSETDVLLFALLRVARSVLRSRPALQWVNRESRILHNLSREFRAIVTVDEAPDFSAVQLGCMYHLSHPAVGAFSMSGDLMQRTTRQGLRSWEACDAFAEDLDVREFRRVYRQSKRLAGVAAELYQHSMQQSAPFDSPYVDTSDPPPLLAVRETDEGESAWLRDRVREIKAAFGQLPSIGIFVPSEEDVGPVAERLRRSLYSDAIDVQACFLGQVLGSADRVRVFSVHHIKGIEFQAVLMLRLDRLSAADADLVDKYLYLGLTRAVQFLGVTVREALPASLECIRSHLLESNWHLRA